MGRHSIEEECGFDRRGRKATDALLGLLKEHHDFSVRRGTAVTQKQVIQIRAESAANVPIDICVLPVAEPVLTIDAIKRVVCLHFGISHTDMMSPRRDKKVAHPRMIAVYLSKTLTQKSLPDIGRIFDRDHTTILHSVRTIGALCAAGHPLAEHVANLREMLTA